MQLPEIESKRLKLREVLMSDAPDIYEYMCLEETTRYLYASVMDYEKTQQFIRVEYLSYFRQGNPSPYAIVLKEENKVIGVCYFHSDCDDMAEIAFILNPYYSHQGYMYEALQELITIGFDVCHYRRIEAFVMEENEASVRLLNRLGFVFEGIKREFAIKEGLRKNVKMFSLLDHEWRKKDEQTVKCKI